MKIVGIHIMKINVYAFKIPITRYDLGCNSYKKKEIQLIPFYEIFYSNRIYVGLSTGLLEQIGSLFNV